MLLFIVKENKEQENQVYLFHLNHIVSINMNLQLHVVVGENGQKSHVCETCAFPKFLTGQLILVVYAR